MDRSRRVTNPTTSTGAVGRKRAFENGTGPGTTSAWPTSDANASITWPLGASGHTANSSTASSVRATSSRRRRSPYVAFQKSFGRLLKLRASDGLVAVLRRSGRVPERSRNRYLHEEVSLPNGSMDGVSSRCRGAKNRLSRS